MGFINMDPFTANLFSGLHFNSLAIIFGSCSRYLFEYAVEMRT